MRYHDGMGTSPTAPAWHVVYVTATGDAPVQFLIESPRGRLFRSVTVDGLDFTTTNATGGEITKYMRAKVEQVATAFTFARAFPVREL